MNFKILLLATLSLLLCACSDASDQLNMDYGTPQPKNRLLPAEHPLAVAFRDDVFPIIEKRCVVCHGCYDAPCQLKLSSPEGIDRGASPVEIYDGARLFSADPSRLFVDAKSTAEWREKGFSPILNERDQTLLSNLQGSLLYQLLLQKIEHPSVQDGRLPEQFDFQLNRENQCVTENTLIDYKQDYPLSGMPYGLPALEDDEFETIQTWVGQGAPMAMPAPLSKTLQTLVDNWELMFNQPSLKAQLINRYLYEHLFLAHLYFSEVVSEKGKKPFFFRLVRSTTPPGEVINEIATRRPFEDPQAKFYYRLQRQRGSILDKTHMPYALNPERKERWNKLFYNNSFEVTVLPDYKDSNPFIVFKAIPSNARYQFLLDEAYFTISGFMKGTVCRGNIALDVINDNFWVFFVKPNLTKSKASEQFILQQAQNLSLPSEETSESFSISNWLYHAKLNTRYVKAKKEFLEQNMDFQKGLTVDDIWSGNDNAALTVFRHFDSASVVKGAVGKHPKTAWVIDYPLLERIHYLLVAGFDVFGNVGHQVTTRLYMDFLRIESEINFLVFLPEEDRGPVIASWYLGATKELSAYLNTHTLLHMQTNNTAIQYKLDKSELLSVLKKHAYTPALQQINNHKYNIPLFDTALKRLSSLDNRVVRELPEVTYILIESPTNGDRIYSLLRHNAHKNIASLLDEKDQRLPHLDTAEIYNGIIGSYPSIIFRVAERDKLDFTNAFIDANNSGKFVALIARYGVRRSNPEFWQVSDKLHQLHYQNNPIEHGLLDYNRLLNR